MACSKFSAPSSMSLAALNPYGGSLPEGALCAWDHSARQRIYRRRTWRNSWPRSDSLRCVAMGITRMTELGPLFVLNVRNMMKAGFSGTIISDQADMNWVVCIPTTNQLVFGVWCLAPQIQSTYPAGSLQHRWPMKSLGISQLSMGWWWSLLTSGMDWPPEGRSNCNGWCITGKKNRRIELAIYLYMVF